MHPDHPRWDEWVEQFTTFADTVPLVPRTPELSDAQRHLCFIGENGLSPEDEFAELALLMKQQDQVKRMEVDTSYYQDTILFIP